MEPRKHEYHEYHKGMWVKIFGFAVIAVGIICYLWLSSSSGDASRKTVTELSSIYLQELSAQKIGQIQTTIDGRFSRLNILIEALNEEDTRDEESLRAFLQRMKEKNDFSLLAFVDEQGIYYSSEGTAPLPDQLNGFLSLTAGEQMTSYAESLTDGDMLLLGMGMTAVEFDGHRLETIVAAYNREDIDRLLSISSDNVRAHSKVYEKSGKLIAECAHEEIIHIGDNLFTGLEEAAQFNGGYSLEAIREAMAAGEEGMTICTIDGEQIYFYYAPLTGTDWYVVTILPYSAMEETVGSFGRTLNVSALLVMLVVVAMLLMMFLYYSRSLKKAARETELARQQAEQANQAKSEFLSHMSHDIRTPINGIIGMTNIALKHKDDPERLTDCIHKISEASSHLLMLINDVLDMSRIESGKVVIAEEPMDMRTLVNSCEEIIRGQVLSRELEFQCETEAFSHPYLLGDELHLRQILINILGNAVKFTQDGGTVRFTVKERQQTGDKVIYRFIIEDNGIGMSEEFQTRIFEAFSQENDNSRTHYNGTGLGMAITKQFVDLMGGTIRVKSKLNEGSAFTVDLPFRVDADREEEPEEAMEDQLVDLTGMKVLLVEDNELNLEIAREILQAEGIRITVAANGEEAVERFKESEEGEFDLVLMDIMMPVMNGYEASQTIRSLDRQDAKNVPIVAMTANAYEEDVKNAFSAGMNAHIPKPVDVDLLIQVLGRYRTS